RCSSRCSAKEGRKAMRSMFQMGFNPGFFWMGNGGRGGRSTAYGNDWEPYRYCDPSMEPCPTPFVGPVGLYRLGQARDHDKTRADLSPAQDKLAAVNQWAANRPQWEQVLGVDLQRYNMLAQQMTDSADTATEVMQRMSSPDSAAWVASDADIRTM